MSTRRTSRTSRTRTTAARPGDARHSVVVVTLARERGATRVAWVMTGENGFVGKAFSLFMDMDAMIGKDFEKGLAQLKGVAEAGGLQGGEAASR